MAFSNSSFFAGVGTAVAAIAVGFAGGTMITTRTVDQPTRPEHASAGTVGLANSAAPQPSIASSDHGRQDTTKPPIPDAQPATVAPAPSASAADSKPAQQPQPAAPVLATTEAATNVQEQSAPRSAEPPTVTKSDDGVSAKEKEDPAPAKKERASTRAADPNRAISHKRVERKSSGDHRLSEHRRRQDEDQRQQNLDAAANVRQMPRDGADDEIIERDPLPRFDSERPRRFELFGEYDAPRMIDRPPPRFGFFGD